jgi:hypothetical protein
LDEILDTYTEEEVQLFWTIDHPVVVHGKTIKEYPAWRNRTFVSPGVNSGTVTLNNCFMHSENIVLYYFLNQSNEVFF